MIGELARHLWQSTFFAVAAGLLTVAFRGNRAQVRYGLWLSASLKFFIPFALLMNVGSSLERWVPATRRIATQIAAPAVSDAIDQFSGPLFPEALPSTPRMPGHIHWIPIGILSVWLCGFLAIVLARFRNWLRIRAAVRTSTAMNIPTAVEVRASAGLLEPGVVGLLRPVLLLPEGIIQRLTTSELETILAHELCHVRRRDNLFALTHMIVEAVFWFHPLVWWIGARLVEERERACDEEVLSLGNHPDVYADAILNVCKLYTESPLACVSGVSGAGVRQRIEAIMADRKVPGLNRAKKVLLASAGLAALAGPVVIGVGNVPVIRAQSPALQIMQTTTPAPIQLAQVQAAPPPTAPQSPAAARPRFEVASIRRCDPNAVVPSGRGRAGGGGGAGPSPDRMTRNCVTVMTLLQDAYVRFADGQSRSPFSLRIPPIEGAPAWIGSDLYTVEAKAESASDLPTMFGPMMQSLLEDRFGLKLRREIRSVPAYELTAARGGSKLKPTVDEGGNCGLDLPPGAIPKGPNGTTLPGFRPGGRFEIPGPLPPGELCRLQLGLMNGPNRLLVARGMGLDEFSAYLVRVTDHPVADKTGLTEKYDVRLEFAPDETAPAPPVVSPPDAPSDIPAGATLFTALEQQLGLKLVPVRGTREFIVIDHIERPSEN